MFSRRSRTASCGCLMSDADMIADAKRLSNESQPVYARSLLTQLADALESRNAERDAVLELHSRYQPVSIPAYCTHDLLTWPCPTVTASGGA